MAELYLLAINLIHQNIRLNMSYQNSRPTVLPTMNLIDKVLKAFLFITRWFYQLALFFHSINVYHSKDRAKIWKLYYKHASYVTFNN